MVIIMNPEATAENIKAVISTIEDAGLEAKVMDGASQRIVGVIGDKRKLGDVTFEAMDGVEKTVAISKSYKLASREFHPRSSVVDVAGVKIGDGTPVVMSGPCAVESREQLFEAADIVKKAGAQFLRGGAYKPRTSPYSFQGLEEQGLKFLAEARERSLCTSARAGSPVIHLLVPLASAVRPSRLIASLTRNHGRPRSTRRPRSTAPRCWRAPRPSSTYRRVRPTATASR